MLDAGGESPSEDGKHRGTSTAPPAEGRQEITMERFDATSVGNRWFLSRRTTAWGTTVYRRIRVPTDGDERGTHTEVRRTSHYWRNKKRWLMIHSTGSRHHADWTFWTDRRND